MNAIWIVLPILTLLMFELGLTLQTEEHRAARRQGAAAWTFQNASWRIRATSAWQAPYDGP